jgi:O-antigen/teichoic acid export membrane protein
LKYINLQLNKAIKGGVARLRQSVSMQNAISSIVSLVWLGGISIFTIPIYISIVGIDEWGLIAACASLQILSNFIDAGFSQIVPRWAAKESGSAYGLRKYLGIFRSIYMVLASFLFLSLQIAAPYLASHWFQVSEIKASDLEAGIRIVSIQLFFQFLNSLNIGFWHGLQMQVNANIRVCIFGTLKHAITIIILITMSQKAWAYTLCFALVALIEFVVNYASLSKMLTVSSIQKLNLKLDVYPIVKEVSLLSAGVLIGLFMSQLDRMVLSRSVDLTSYGIYTILISLALAVLQLQSPVTRAFFPILVQDLQNGGGALRSIMRKMIVGTVAICTLPALAAVVFAPQILTVWINDGSVVAAGVWPLRLLLTAVALNSIYGCIYVIILALGRSDKILKINLGALCIVIIMVALVQPYNSGLALGGYIWICTSCAQLILGSGWLAFQIYNRKPMTLK